MKEIGDGRDDSRSAVDDAAGHDGDAHLVDATRDWGLVLLVVALIVIKLIERAMRAVLTRLKLGELVKRIGLDETLRRAGIVQPLETLVPRLVYYLLLILVAQTVADSVGLAAVSEGFRAFFVYLPNLLSAVLIVLLGTVVAQFVGQMVTRVGSESGIDFAASLGNMISGLIIFVVAIIGISQLRIDTEVIRIVVACVLGGITLAFGLSFGLGTREITRNLIAGFYARKIFQPGDELEIKGERGVLRSITPTQTLLVQPGDKIVAVSNASFLEDVVRQ